MTDTPAAVLERRRIDADLNTIDEELQQFLELVSESDSYHHVREHLPGTRSERDRIHRSTDERIDRLAKADNGVPMIVEGDSAETTVLGPDPAAFERTQTIGTDREDSSRRIDN